jgi:hypothetical protein
MMHGLEKSDPAIVATKPVNKAGQPAAEWVEPRVGTEGNAGQSRTHRTQCRESVSQGLERVRQAARLRKKERFTALMHHVTVERLWAGFDALKQRSAPGIDGVPWKTQSSSGQSWRCSMPFTSRTSGDSRMDSGLAEGSMMQWMPSRSGFRRSV